MLSDRLARKGQPAINQATPPARRGQLWREMVRNRWAYFFIAPFFLLFGVFGAFPPIYSLYLSFHEWDILSPMKPVGFANYVRVFGDELFWKGVTNGILFGLMATVPGLSLALVIAYLLHRYTRRLRDFYLAAYFSPMVTSVVAVVVIFTMLYSSTHGLLNAGLQAVGLPAVRWLEEVWPLRSALAIFLIWQWLGWNVILFLAGLQAISEEVYDAARVDGANGLDIFWRITVPLLRPTITFNVVISTIGILQLFAEPALLTGGGSGNPAVLMGGRDNAVLTVPLYLYVVGFKRFKFGYAAAASYVMFMVVLIMTLLNRRLVRGRDAEDNA
jgi:cellobiose transport system permease protein